MKKLLLMLTLVVNLPIIYAQNTCPTQPPGASCPPVGDPYIELTWAGVQRYLARGMAMEALVNLNFSSGQGPNGWALNILGNSCHDPNDVNYTDPCDQQFPCSTPFCPDRYCANIQQAANLNASILYRTAGVWHEKSRYQDPNFVSACTNLVNDVNRAYDCAGHRRPIIQAAVFFEAIRDVENLNITIPTDVIFDLSSDLNEASYYLDASGAPKSNLQFDLNRMKVNGIYDIYSDELRLFYYYEAKFFINKGYTSLHLGQPDEVSGVKHGNLTPVQKLQRKIQLSNLLDKMRNHATSLNSFVLLTFELGQNEKYILNNTMMFDYYSVAAKAMEIGNAPNNYRDLLPCNVAMPNANMYNIPDCTNDQYPATIDPCHGFINKLDNVSADPPSPYTGFIDYYQNVPFSIYYDFGPKELPNGQTTYLIGTHGVASSDVGDCWGYGDADWFNIQMSTPCKAAWVENEMCHINRNTDYAGGRGYLQAPGLIGRYSPGGGLSGWLRGYFHMYEHQAVVDAVENVWEVKTPVIYHRQICFMGKWKYFFSVDNRDCSSIYSWHIKDPNGNWAIQYHIGEEYNFTPTMIGNYTVYLRQDNLGLTGTQSYGSETYTMNLNVQSLSCQPKPGKGNDTSTKNIAYQTIVDADDEFYTEYIFNAKRSALPTSTVKNVQSLEQVNTYVEVYPNPAHTEVTISFNAESNSNVNISIVDITGKTVLTESGHHDYSKLFSKKIDISKLTPGTYNMIITNNASKFREKLVIIR